MIGLLEIDVICSLCKLWLFCCSF